jgi:folate-binding protein YgfZ
MNASPLEHWHASHGAIRLQDVAEPLRYGDARAEYEAVAQSAGLFDASASRDRLLVTGDDRIAFIQGLCTNDVELLPVGGSCEAAFITPKGRLIADVRITRLDDALLFDMEAGRSAALQEELAKYRIHERAEWSDASADLSALELWGPGASTIVGATIPDGSSQAVDLGENAFLTVGTPFGLVLYVPADAASVVADALVQRAALPVGREAIEVRRIELGLGRFGIDWNESTNPLEAGLDRALNYKKGCYVGQEVVAKATYIGHVNRRLVRLTWEGDVVPAGTTLLGGKSPGRITSCARVPGESRVVALGVVRRESAAAGSQLQVGEGGPTGAVVGYPFASREKPV